MRPAAQLYRAAVSTMRKSLSGAIAACCKGSAGLVRGHDLSLFLPCEPCMPQWWNPRTPSRPCCAWRR